MFKTISAAQFRSEFSQCLTHVLMREERLLIARNGRDTAALVTVKDMDALEQVERNSERFLHAKHEAQMREWRMLREALGET